LFESGLGQVPPKALQRSIEVCFDSAWCHAKDTTRLLDALVEQDAECHDLPLAPR